MGFKTITGIQWTNLELKGLLKDEDSCVYLEKVQKHLGLHPFHLTNLNEALREILNASLNFYDSELDGLLLAYKNPKILSPFGDILYDTCFVHIDIEADFYIFRPEIGRSLKGFVNKKGTKHIGILVHKAFNVSLPKPDDTENEEDWPGNKVKVGQEIRFTLDKIDYTTRLPYIRGSINKEEYLSGCQPFNEQIASTYESECHRGNNWNIKEECRDMKNKSKVKNKKIIFNDSDTEVNLVSDSEKKSENKKLKPQFHQIEVPVKISSKKRKRKSSSISEQESELLEENHKKLSGRIQQNLTRDSDDSTLKVSKNTSKKQKKNFVENDDTFNDRKKEKVQKYSLKTLSANIISDDFDDEIKELHNNGIDKKHKMSSNNTHDVLNKEGSDSLIRNLTNESFTDNPTDQESNKLLIKKSKKRKKKLDLDDEEEIEILQKNLKSVESNIESEIEISKVHSTKRKRNSTLKNTLNNMEDEKNKSCFQDFSEKTTQNSESKMEMYQSPSKKRKKKHEKDEENHSDDERIYKKSRTHRLSDDVDSNDLNNLKCKDSNKQSKNKKINHSISKDTEDKRVHKKSLVNNLSDKLESNDSNDTEFNVSNKQLKKKKHITTNDDIFMSNDGERVHKKSPVKKMLDNTESTVFNGIECDALNKPLKKKKRTTNDKIPADSLDGEIHKKSLNNDLANIIDLNNCNNMEFSETKILSKKKNTSLENDDKFIDKGDKRMSKSSRKSLVQFEANDNILNGSEFKEPKQKKHKKKHKSSDSNE